MATTYINRANTDAEVLRRANLHDISSNELGSKIVPIQDTLKTRRIALAGRILRQNNEHPMRMVSFKNDSASPIEVLFRRVGRPRKQWTYNTLALIWNQIRQTDAEFNNSREQLVQILDAANRERFWKPPLSGWHLDFETKSTF